MGLFLVKMGLFLVKMGLFLEKMKTPFLNFLTNFKSLALKEKYSDLKKILLDISLDY
jgi:hypothetical protein